jgi:hypothetical protein
LFEFRQEKRGHGHAGITNIHFSFCTPSGVLGGRISRLSRGIRADSFIADFCGDCADSAFVSRKGYFLIRILYWVGIDDGEKYEKMRAPSMQLHHKVRKVLQPAM